MWGNAVQPRCVGRYYPCDMCSMSIIIHRVCIVILEIITADHFVSRAKATAERRISVINASVDNADHDTVAFRPEFSPHRIGANLMHALLQ